MDTFERASLGANWTNSGFGSGSVCVIVGSSDLSATGTPIAMCYWNANTPPVPGYACGQLSGSGTAADFSPTGVCLGVTTTSGGNGACCEVLSTGGPLTWQLTTITSGSEVISESAGTPAFAAADYIGIQRTSATAFRCYRSTNGTTWTALGSGGTLTVPNPGNAGAEASPTASAWTMETWEEGAGSLPTARACGTP